MTADCPAALLPSAGLTRSTTTCVQPPGAQPSSTMRRPGRSRWKRSSSCSSLKAAPRAIALPLRLADIGSLSWRASHWVEAVLRRFAVLTRMTVCRVRPRPRCRPCSGRRSWPSTDSVSARRGDRRGYPRARRDPRRAAGDRPQPQIASRMAQRDDEIGTLVADAGMRRACGEISDGKFFRDRTDLVEIECAAVDQVAVVARQAEADAGQRRHRPELPSI